MSIEDAGSIDSLGISKVGNKAVLVISDHLNWEDEKYHFDLLEKKVGGYLGFVKGGQMLEVLPDSKGREVRIELIYEFQPSEAALQFLAAAKQQLKPMGVEFTYKELPEGY